MYVKVKKLHPDAVVPSFSKEGDAGADLVAVENAELYHGQITMVRTGIAVEIPKGYEMQVRPRSGLAAKKGVTIVNAPGTVDAGFRGEVMVIMTLFPHGAYFITKGDRIAQAVINELPKAAYVEVDKLSTTDRAGGGMGSTGK